MNEQFTCPVCGYPDLSEPPRLDDGGGSYEICWSCGFEYGVTDDAYGHTYAAWRQKWVALGMPWASAKLRPPPPNWNPAEQLAALLD